MTTLAEIMLDVASALGAAKYGEASSGTTTSLVDETLNKSASFYTGGTCWILTGENAGQCLTVSAFRENTITLPTLAHAIAAGDEYALAPGGYFPKQALKAAVLSALRSTPVLLVEADAITTADDTLIYTLPAGISDVRRVAYLEDNEYQILYNWYELPTGELCFYAQPESGKSLHLFYAGRHSWIGLQEHINPGVSLEWLKWASVVNLYRDYIVSKKKDNPTALELFNEAKINEATKIAADRKSELRMIEVEGQYKAWG